MADINSMGKHFAFGNSPIAAPEAIVATGKARFTVLTDRLIRMEFSGAYEFEDRASQVFWHRAQPVPQYTSKEKDGILTIDTAYLTLTYHTEGTFYKAGLSVALKTSGAVWHYGDQDSQNLKGTRRTLDRTAGEAELEDGLMSRSGWAVVDDGKTPVFNEANLLEERGRGEAFDLYFFGYGTDYKACLKDFCRIAGRIPMPPRFALGNWWSKYNKYSDKDLRELMQDFKDRDIPISVCVVDMDWHIVENEYHRGWTGYTWNKEYFPNPRDFIEGLHGSGIKTALNLHPADGVAPHEERYAEMARRMGVDPESGQTIEFDITDPRFIEAYFEVLHHPHEEAGVDFWWMDWQQGTTTKVTGLDPLWLLNHLHFYDLGRDGKKRRFVFSRWGGLGNHRYPIGFSGDTIVGWDTLAFQPRFTATAANVGYCWWSHDIGGHYKGKEDDELYTRWVQYGVFSPIFRLHSNPVADRRPWTKNDEAYKTAGAAMRLRHALIPYIYSMAWKMHKENEAFIRPMYYDHPDEENAYRFPDQYWFGSELIAAPVIKPADPATGKATQEVWLPQGDWYSFFTGEHFEGGKIHTVRSSLQEIPVFAKAGAIVPMAPEPDLKNVANPERMDVRVFPGADNVFQLYEDDGESMDFKNGGYCITKLRYEWDGQKGRLITEEPRGDLDLIPGGRKYTVIYMNEGGQTKALRRRNGG